MEADIRHATSDDVVDIAALLGELGYPQPVEQVRSRLDAATDRGHFVLVAVIGDRLVGVLSAAVVPLLAEAATMVRVTTLSVTASARGRGVGRALIRAAEGRALDMGATVFEVCSGRRPERAAAHRFYAAMGFEDANPRAARYWKWFDHDSHG